MKALALFFILLFTILISFGQSDEDKIIKQYLDFGYNNPREIALLSIGRTLYFSGESIPFSSVLIDQYLEPDNTFSRILHISLVGENGSFWDYPYEIKNGSAVSSKIPLSEDLPSGNYQLIASTEFMRNHDFEYQNHRIPIYIQNPTEKPKEIVKSILYPDNNLNNSSIKNNISIEPSDKDLKITISAKQGDYFLVSEGFNNIQFIAKVKVRKKSTSLLIPKYRLDGQFQRLVLLDQNLNLSSTHSYFVLNESDNFTISNLADKIASDQERDIPLKTEEALFGSLVFSKDDFFQIDSLHLFKRFFRHYYNIPNSISIDSLSFYDLISKEYLAKLEYYSFNKWTSILKPTQKPVIKHLPQTDVSINGVITGRNPIPPNSTLRIHLFHNDMNVFGTIQKDTFHVDLLAPTGEDIVCAGLFDNAGIPLEEHGIVFIQPSIDYIKSTKFWDSKLTTPLIAEKLNFKYIISTFNKIEKKRKYFWEDKRYDESFKVNDYYDLASLEEFIREVLSKTSLRSERGNKIMRMYSSDENSFLDSSPLMIKDNEIVTDLKLILDIPLESIEEIRQVYKLKTLQDFGNVFTNGIFIVKTNEEGLKKDSFQNESFEKLQFSKFFGYSAELKDEVIQHSFSETPLVELTLKNDFNSTFYTGKELGYFKLNYESISKKGVYRQEAKAVEIIK